MDQTIREQIMRELGITNKQASMLIKTVGSRHQGVVASRRIIHDLKKIAGLMIENVCNQDRYYDVEDELNDSEPKRQLKAIEKLLPEKEYKLALFYLGNKNSDSVAEWKSTLCAVAKSQIQNVLSYGIGSYRIFVNELPYSNINRVSRTFGLESVVARFIAEKGDKQDLRLFISDVEPFEIQGAEVVAEYRSCSKKYEERIFNAIQTQIKKNGEVFFDRKRIIIGLSAIDNNTQLKYHEKEILINEYLSCFVQGKDDLAFVKKLNSGEKISLEQLMQLLGGNEKTPVGSNQEEFTGKVVAAAEEKERMGKQERQLANLKEAYERLDPEEQKVRG